MTKLITDNWFLNFFNTTYRDRRPIVSSEGGLTIFTTEGSFPIPSDQEGRFDEVVIRGWQEPHIGVTANSITYVYIRYWDEQVVADTTLPSPLEGILIATVTTDYYNVTSIVNHYPTLPNFDTLPTLPSDTGSELGNDVFHSTSFIIEKPKIKIYLVDLDAFPSYTITSVSYKSNNGSGEMEFLKNDTSIGSLSSLVIDNTVKVVIPSSNNTLNVGDSLSINVYSSNALEDLSISFRLRSARTAIIP